jgi:hypothetical protein
MKKAVVTLVAAAVAGSLWAQMNPRGTASLEGAKVSIEYGKPSAKGRDVFAMIEPGSYWRMGADDSTKLTTDVPLLIGGSRVEKGEYVLLGQFASRDEFHLVVANGLSGSEPKEVAAKAKGELSKGHDHVEAMTIVIEGKPADAAIVLSWASSRIRMPFKVAQ